jgi:hypothetical protein
MKKDLEKKWPWLRQTMKKGDCSQPKLATPSWPPHFFSLPMIFWRKKFEKFIESDEKRLRKKVALIKTDYEEKRLQPTPAGHPQLATPRANYFLLVVEYVIVPCTILSSFFVLFKFIIGINQNLLTSITKMCDSRDYEVPSQHSTAFRSPL